MNDDAMAHRLRLGNVLWYRVLRPRLFRKEAEAAHLFTVQALARMQVLRMLRILALLYRSPLYRTPVRVFGQDVPNPVWLAAGFDKHGEVIPALEALGFGAVEIGTVTPRPQFGNETPRLFRNPQNLAVLNRYGFNSHGSRVVADRLRRLHARCSIKIPIGISIGKNKDTADLDAAKDYLKAYEDLSSVLRPIDWVKINISSPNTPQLRDIFDRLDDFLGEFVESARRVPLRAGPGKRFPHRFALKVPPDGLSPRQLERVVEVCAKHGFAGIEATNTTVDETIKARCGWAGQAGGVSGEPLRALATRRLEEMAATAREKRVDLVGVGGISQGRHALEKRVAGARAVQIYTGLVFRGPGLIHEVLSAWSRG